MFFSGDHFASILGSEDSGTQIGTILTALENVPLEEIDVHKKNNKNEHILETLIFTIDNQNENRLTMLLDYMN